MPERPEVSAAFRIDAKWNGLDQVWPVDRILIIEAVLSHHFGTRERAFVSRQQVMNMHRPGIDILQIGALQGENTCIWTIELCMFAHEVRGMISRIKIFPVTCADVHLVVAGRSIE